MFLIKSTHLVLIIDEKNVKYCLVYFPSVNLFIKITIYGLWSSEQMWNYNEMHA